MKTNIFLELRDINKNFLGKKNVIQNLSLQISKNSFFVLVGPSGCGKSTLLKIISGLVEPDSGQIIINKIDCTNLEPGKRNIAMVFQDLALYPNMTVEENLTFALKSKKVSRDKIENKLKMLLTLLKLEDIKNRLPDEISGGEKQRTALGRAMIKEPDIYLMDEPMSNLDLRLKSSLIQELSTIHKTLPSTIIYVTHDQEEAMQLADAVGVMFEGKIMQLGSPEDIYKYPKNLFVATFFGHPIMNIAQAKIQKNNLIFNKKNLGTKEKLGLNPKNNANTCLIGIRPEDIIIKTGRKTKMHFEVVIKNVSNLGNSFLIYFDLPVKPSKLIDKYYGEKDIFRDSEEMVEFIAKLPPNIKYEMGQSVLVEFPINKLVFFDSDSGENLMTNLTGTTIDF